MQAWPASGPVSLEPASGLCRGGVLDRLPSENYATRRSRSSRKHIVFSIILTAGISAGAAILAALLTAALTRRREHEGDWRRLKLARYQEFVLALSGVVAGRSSSEAHRRYADAVNSMALVSPRKVLLSLRAFQNEISYMNAGRTDTEHDRTLNELFHAMRDDVWPGRADDQGFEFRLLGVPPSSEAKDQ